MVSAVDDDDDGPNPSEAVRQAIVDLENENGRLTPDDVVEEARKEHSPLHACFPWDDAVAARERRLDIARRLIRRVKVVITTSTRVITTVRYGRDPQAAPGQGYVAVDRLRTEPENARAFVRLEFQRAAAALKRAEDLAEVLGLRHSVATLRRSVEALAQELGLDQPTA